MTPIFSTKNPTHFKSPADLLFRPSKMKLPPFRLRTSFRAMCPPPGDMKTGDVELSNASLVGHHLLLCQRGGMEWGGAASSLCSVALPPARSQRTGGVCALRAVFLTPQQCPNRARTGPTELLLSMAFCYWRPRPPQIVTQVHRVV